MRNPAIHATITQEAFNLLEKDAIEKNLSLSAWAAIIIESFYEIPLSERKKKTRRTIRKD